ncbi:MAG TPA: alpha/beta hydrolase [Xanthomonadaceae bacterium]|nr:alpha/beta hydrolase [Xanthomonadaceae bacterium]
MRGLSLMRELSLETARGRLAAVRHGHAGGPRVLALHGWLDNAASFAPLAALLPGLDLVALDLAGHGQSCHRPEGAWYHLVDNNEDVAAALDALGWERAALLGHSLGGAVATMFAAAAPERVARLVLVEALGPLPFEPGTAARSLAGALRDRRAVAGKRLRVFEDVAEAVQARMAANALSEAAARTLVERALAPVEGGFVWRSDPRLTLTTPVRAHEQQIREWIAAIQCPTLVVAADPPGNVLGAELRNARFGSLREGHLATLPGGHHLHLENAAAVAAAIGPFLSGEG